MRMLGSGDLPLEYLKTLLRVRRSWGFDVRGCIPDTSLVGRRKIRQGSGAVTRFAVKIKKILVLASVSGLRNIQGDLRIPKMCKYLLCRPPMLLGLALWVTQRRRFREPLTGTKEHKKRYMLLINTIAPVLEP